MNYEKKNAFFHSRLGLRVTLSDDEATEQDIRTLKRRATAYVRVAPVDEGDDVEDEDFDQKRVTSGTDTELEGFGPVILDHIKEDSR